MLQTIANRFILAWGWHRLGMAFIAGALSALSQAPFHFFPVLWLTFPALVWLIDGAVDANKTGRLSRWRPAALIGWWFGFGYFLAGLWWVGSAFLVEADTFGWLLPFAVVALPAGLALFWALGVGLARLFWSESPTRILVLAVTLGGAEWLRGHILSGFPWNALGYGLAANGIQMQAAALVGVESLTFIAIVIFAAPAVLVGIDNARRRAAIVVAGFAAILFLGVFGYGAARLATASDARDDSIRLRIVQPAIPQKEKWRPENRKRILETYLALSDRTTSPDRLGMLSVTHLIWPESAFPFLLTEEPEALAAISNLLPPGTVLISGAVRAEPAVAGSPRRFFNSIYVINHDGTILDAYDKVDLVPFGEYLPAQDFLESLGLRQLTRLAGGFTAGTQRRPLAIPGAPPAIPSICYEIIFPANAAYGAEAVEPAWILNVTNDAWFGVSPGPYQHLHQARLRAIEQGLPVIRAANTGISAVIDPYGRIVGKVNLNVADVIDSTLPRKIAKTLYAQIMNYCQLVIVMSLVLLTMIVNRTLE